MATLFSASAQSDLNFNPGEVHLPCVYHRSDLSTSYNERQREQLSRVSTLSETANVDRFKRTCMV